MEFANEENQDNISTVNDYEEIDNVSYHSVAWRNYNFESDERPNTNSGTESISVHQYTNTYISNTYEDLDDSTTYTHKYETINKDWLEGFLSCSFFFNSPIDFHADLVSGYQ